jgi:hypothetical protein
VPDEVGVPVTEKDKLPLPLANVPACKVAVKPVTPVELIAVPAEYVFAFPPEYGMVAVAEYAMLIVAADENDPLPQDKADILALLSVVPFFLQETIVNKATMLNKRILMFCFLFECY